MKLKDIIRRFLYKKPKYPYDVILDVIKKAKINYYKYKGTGMCTHLYDAIESCKYLNINEYKDKCVNDDFNIIKFFIPEFNRKFFNINKDNICYWWPRYDTESRLKAFDKLINLYEEKLKIYNENFN